MEIKNSDALLVKIFSKLESIFLGKKDNPIPHELHSFICRLNVKYINGNFKVQHAHMIYESNAFLA